MSAEKEWLAMLEQATSYGDLQSAFAKMSADSQSTDDGDAMVASIDEAIRRIEQERARDQAELEGFSSDYEAFKQEQSGVIGWFKRKLPFTETRKQELGHRDAMNDQAAEILADNFVIARAQMLKERIASPELRRMGHKPSYWRSLFLTNDSTSSIGEYGKLLLELGKELTTGKTFVDTVKIDIDAFSEAKFTNSEDQLRSNQDLKAAQGELKTLVDESLEKNSLRSSALVTLKELLINELSEKDGDFKTTNQRLGLLKNLQDKQPRLAKGLEERLTNAKTLVAKMVERDAIPEKREKLENSISTLRRDWDDAERRSLRAASDLKEPSELYQAALTDVQKANGALAATKPLYEAYLAEQNKNSSNAAEVASARDFELAPSNVVMEYLRLEETAKLANQTLSQRTPSFEQAKRTHDIAVNEVKAIRDKTDAITLDLKKIAELDNDIQQQLLKAKQSIEAKLPEFRIAADAYLDAARQIVWADASTTSLRAIQELLQEQTIPSIAAPGSKDLTAMQRHTERLERAIQAINSDSKFALREVATLANLRKEALQRRGQMLLDQSILDELDLG